VKPVFAQLVTVLGLILSGSPEASAAPRPASPGSTGTNQPRHGFFLAPVRPAIPAVKNQRWVRNPIDAFVLARLEENGLTPSPEADRRTLIRRLSFDLLGLPPTPEQVRDFLADTAPAAYERLVDGLLASPHYGERWARHWLDLARYADTSGYQVDRPRPYAYLYRDWLIDAINRDLPFDQFTIEQLAGDLLPNATWEQKTAAGFHRLTLMNHEDGVDEEEFRCKAKVDRVSTTGTVWLGLTLGCAECHNHKYDPITQREFYQLYAFFNNADEVDLPAPQAGDPARYEQEKKAWDAELIRLKAQLSQLTQARDPRAAEVRRQLASHRRAEPKSLEARALSFQESTNPPRAYIHIRGDFLRKGDEVGPGTPAVLPPLDPRDKTGRATCLPSTSRESQGQSISAATNAPGVKAAASTRSGSPSPDRLDLARWIVAPQNPLTARVAVNHVWQHLFGRGLVSTPEDFGTRGEPPSHPELLDWLAIAFSTPSASRPQEAHASKSEIRNPKSEIQNALGWSRNALIKLIVTSATYRQSSHVRAELQERDPQNLLLARQNRFRLESEIIRDACLAAGGLLNDDIGGPSFHPYMSEDVKKLGTAGAFTWTDTEGPEKYRRGLYIFAQRTVPYPTSMTFDQADPTQTCPRRDRSNTPLQALTLLNHGLFVECAQGLAGRMANAPTREPRERIRYGFELCLARPPTRQELSRLETLYDEQRRHAERSPAECAKLAGGCDSAKLAPAEAASLVALSQVLLNLDEFVTRE